jgi:hypothetical protein
MIAHAIQTDTTITAEADYLLEKSIDKQNCCRQYCFFQDSG